MARSPRPSSRGFERRRPPWIPLALVSLAAFALRVGYAFGYQRNTKPTGDAFYYHYQANLLVAGKAFINPYDILFTGRAVPSADHPPLFTLVLALAAFIGLKSFFSQIIWTCGVGSVGVFLVGLAAREVLNGGAGAQAGSGGAVVGSADDIRRSRAGLIAAGIAGLYPVFVINDGALMSESLVLATTAIVVLCYFRLWHRPTFARAAWLGVSCAAASLTRAEFALVIPVLIIPMLFMRSFEERVAARIGLVAMMSLAALAIFAPWWGYNATRFKDPVLLSDQLGVTLVSGNCNSTYYGPRIGYWAFSCPQQLGVHLNPKDDASQQDYQLRHAAIKYMEKHESRVPLVMAARLGREFGVFAPVQQINFEWQALNRPRLPAFLGLGVYYAAALFALPGAVILRRRGVSLLLFGAVFVDTVLVCLATFGQTRYRTGLDVVIVMLASVTLTELSIRRSRHRHPERWPGDSRDAVGAAGWEFRAPPQGRAPRDVARFSAGRG